MNPDHFLCIAPCHIQSPGLPDGWVSIQHASGATVYFHRESRVCTWGMPYTLKKGVTVKVRLLCINVVRQLHTCTLAIVVLVCVQCPISHDKYTMYNAHNVHIILLVYVSLRTDSVFNLLYNCMYCKYVCVLLH